VKTKTTYICESCNEEYSHEENALLCEQQCHLNLLCDDAGLDSPFEDFDAEDFGKIIELLKQYFNVQT
jgi:hypothetical protein